MSIPLMVPAEGCAKSIFVFIRTTGKTRRQNIDAACQVIMSIIEQNGAEDMAENNVVFITARGMAVTAITREDIDELSVKLMESEGVY